MSSTTDIAPAILPAIDNPFGGVIPRPEALAADPACFQGQLRASVAHWRAAGFRVVWLEIPIERAALIPVAVAAGFGFHHTTEASLMLTLVLEAGAFVPPYATHYIGAGGVAVNRRGELLVVRERYHRDPARPPRFKLPGGAVHAGEHLAAGVVREVLEETGVRTRFEALVCLRHWHGYRHGKSDIYFVCRLRPLSAAITIEAEEIAEARWMPLDEYLADAQVSDFNKRVVRAAVDSPGLTAEDLQGHVDAARLEFFLPPSVG